MRRRILCLVLVIASGCGGSTKNQPTGAGSSGAATSAAASRACVVGKFQDAMEDDGHGVNVVLSDARTSATGYQPSSQTNFYLYDKGNPTRGLKAGDEVWLIQNEPDDIFPWLYLAADQARAQCPALPPITP
jgi:hypothetical protein